MRRAYRPAAIGLAAVVALAVGWFVLRDPDGSGAAHEIHKPAQLRVLARPWAEVHLDGKLVDVTPIGMPIEVSPGRHKVVFKHPNAPDELRTIDVAEGQTVVLDVEMNVTVPKAPSAEPEPDAAADEEP
jgi:serine/threonine-protein kinase